MQDPPRTRERSLGELARRECCQPNNPCPGDESLVVQEHIPLLSTLRGKERRRRLDQDDLCSEIVATRTMTVTGHWAQ